MNNSSALPLTVPDLVWVDDLDSFARETTSDLETLVQDVYHMMVEDPGSNLDVPDRGVGILSFLSGDASMLKTAQNRIDQQLPLDARIDAAQASITRDADGKFEIKVRIQVDGVVVGISFAYAAADGLSLVSWGVQ